MIHELCSEYNRKTPCMTENKCSKRYPHGRTLTSQVKNQKAVVNNSRIVPYSLPLSKIFVSTEIRSRISNISVCHERKRHGCIFNNNEEISQYQMRRYVSSNGSIQAKLVETGECNNCTLWNFISCLTWGNEFFESGASVDLITSGSWQPQYGLKLYDNVFPHSVHGFRGKTLPIISFHVSVIFIENLLQYINISL